MVIWRGLHTKFGPSSMGQIMFIYIWLVLAFASCVAMSHSELPVCRGTEHVNGSWVERSANATKKSFYCCGRNGMSVLVGQDDQRCGNFTITDHVFYGSNEYETHIADDACSCDITHDTRLTMSQRERYYWQPTSCNLIRWNSEKFCEYLGKRKLMLLGDSTMEQVAVTLMSMITVGKGGCANQVMLGRSNFLSFTSLVDSNFNQLVSANKPDICILNVGAHLEDMGDLWNIFGSIKPGLLNFRSTLNTTFVWKTMSPGHPNCDKATSPVHEMPVLAHDKRWYQWDLFAEFDRAAKLFAAEIAMPVMDVSPLYYRPDAHVGFHTGFKEPLDCLHYCMPGPLDLFAVQLMTMLHNKEI